VSPWAQLDASTSVSGRQSSSREHYLGPFEAYASAPADTPFRESQGRLEHQNFYYDQEDILFRAAADGGFTWSVHRRTQ
jgi:hypothetical protein